MGRFVNCNLETSTHLRLFKSLESGFYKNRIFKVGEKFNFDNIFYLINHVKIILKGL